MLVNPVNQLLRRCFRYKTHGIQCAIQERYELRDEDTTFFPELGGLPFEVLVVYKNSIDFSEEFYLYSRLTFELKSLNHLEALEFPV